MMNSKERTVKVLHFSSRYEECGVAKYLAHHINGMADVPGIYNEYFEVSPYQTPHMTAADLQRMADRLRVKLKDFDILHIQFEFAIYAHDSFKRIVEAGKRSGKKVVLTVHISPSLHGASKKPHLTGVGPHSFVKYARDFKHHNHFMQTYAEPFRQADLILAHNEPTLESLRSLGVAPERLRKIVHPVQLFSEPVAPSHLLSEQLLKQPGDIIYCTIGFLHRFKGIMEAVKALKFLPGNYKLAILGGMKADSDDVAFYNRLTDLIDQLGLHDRVYISGYIKDDDQLNALIRECDVCVFAYDRVYYASVSSGSFNLAFANGMPVVAYPTASIKELAQDSDGAVLLCETFAYYELARSLKHIDLKRQAQRSKVYAEKMSWPKVSRQLAEIYKSLT